MFVLLLRMAVYSFFIVLCVCSKERIKGRTNICQGDRKHQPLRTAASFPLMVESVYISRHSNPASFHALSKTTVHPVAPLLSFMLRSFTLPFLIPFSTPPFPSRLHRTLVLAQPHLPSCPPSHHLATYLFPLLSLVLLITVQK